MVLDRQKVWTDGWTDGWTYTQNGRTDGRMGERSQNYIPPASSGDNNMLVIRAGVPEMFVRIVNHRAS